MPALILDFSGLFGVFADPTTCTDWPTFHEPQASQKQRIRFLNAEYRVQRVTPVVIELSPSYRAKVYQLRAYVVTVLQSL